MIYYTCCGYNLGIISNKIKQLSQNDDHCLCVINICDYVDETEVCDILNECKGRHKPNIRSYYYDRKYGLSISFVFFSSCSLEQAKTGNIHDRNILVVTPEILSSLDVAKKWRSIKKNKRGLDFIVNNDLKYSRARNWRGRDE
jgi:hypothetical protein